MDKQGGNSLMKLPNKFLIILLSLFIFINIAGTTFAQNEEQWERIQEALNYYVNKVRSSPRNLPLHRELMEEYTQAGLAAIPVFVYQDAVKRNPKNYIVLYVMGYAYLKQYMQSQLSVGGYLFLERQNSDGKSMIQMSFVENLPYSPLEMAKENLMKALDAKPDFPDAIAAMGDYYMLTDKPDKALSKWQEAVKMDSKCEPAHLSMARFYRAMGRYNEAVSEYQKAISISSRNSARKYLELGITYMNMDDLKKAESALLKARSYDKNMGIIYYKLGQVYAKQGEREKAVDMYRDGKKYDSNNAQAAYDLAHIFLNTNDIKYALMSLERGLTIDAFDDSLSREILSYIEKGTIPAANFLSQLSDFEYSDNFHLHYFLGKLYIKEDNKDLALRHFRSASALNPDHADVHYQLGLLQEETQPELAKEEYQKAAELDPTQLADAKAQADLLFKTAQDYLERGMEAKFIETARKGLALYPNNVDIHLQLADIFKKRADIYRNNGKEEQEKEALEDAVKHYEQAAELQPDPKKWYNLGLLYERQGKIKAVRAYDKAIQLDPDFAKAYYRRGNFRLNYKVGRVNVLVYEPEVAIDDLKKAIEIDPELADAHFSLGKAYFQMDRPEEATAEFAKTVEVDPTNYKAHIYLAQDYANSGDNQKVIFHLTRAAELNDKDVEVLKDLASSLLKYGDEAGLKPAMKALEKAYRLKPDDSEILNNYGYTLYMDRMFTQAIDKLQKALEIRPDYPEANYNIALAYSGTREYDLAKKHWQKVVELKPNSDLASKSREFLKKLAAADAQ
ncbi:tetratricopeptide repeat protein [Candidatus Poribacteria bacterium]|nr:tetratricopeptide repeat protein [Candidatus Poribacteria bacterium]